MRVHRGVASVQEHEVPGEKECGPQHRVRDSGSQVESSNFTIYQDGAMRLETEGEAGKRKTKKADTDPYIMDIHPEPELIKLLKSETERRHRNHLKGCAPDLFHIK